MSIAVPTIFSPPRGLRLRALVVVPCLALCCCTAWGAATVNIDTGKSLSLQPGESGSIAMSFTNVGSESSFMAGYTLALMFVQTSGDGALTFDLWTGPASNPLLSDPDAEYTPFDQPGAFQLLAPVVISGTDYFDYFSVQGLNTNEFDDELAVGTTKNVGVVNLSAGFEAGTWDVYVVNQAPEEGGLPVSFMQLSDFTDFEFGNLAALDGARLLIGSVTVVPEPSSIALVGCGGLALVASRCRRRAARRDGLRPETNVSRSLLLGATALAVAISIGVPAALAADEAALGKVRGEWMKPASVGAASPIDRDGVKGRVLCGYQGWFTAEGDGAGLGWRHWRIPDRNAPQGSRFAIDMLPDMSELAAEERFASDLVDAAGRPIELFSSHKPETVNRHFQWMHEHGIDGVFVQRFGCNLELPKMLAHSTKVLGSCRDAALQHGRVYAVMYDLTGMKSGSLATVAQDWKHLRERMKIGTDEASLRIAGKPLVAVWGIGFKNDRDYTLAECRDLVAALEADGCAVLCGVPTGWRTLDRDALNDPLLHEIVGMCDIVCPWTVGRYRTPEQATLHAERDWKADIEWCRERGIEYLPVAFPGFSWHNLKGAELNAIPRLGGRFLWSQAVGARRAGAGGLYVAMFDEVDEGTAIFKCIDPPTAELRSRFIGMEGLPSDHYLRLTGEIGRLFRGERPLSDDLP